MLCRWALVLQEYDFEIELRKGKQIANTDALSHRYTPCALIQVESHLPLNKILTAQKEDTFLSQVLQARKQPGSHICPDWQQHPLRQYQQLWSQLKVVYAILCQEYTSSPASQTVVVPILPPGLHHAALLRCHDAPGAGHLGAEKTLEQLRSLVHWVGMSSDVKQYCQKCYTCQRAKPPIP